MIVNSGPLWLPEPETFGSSRGGGAAQRCRLAISRNPPVGIEIVREPFRRVESSSLDSVFSVRDCCVTVITLMMVAVFMVGMSIGDIVSKTKQANTHYTALISYPNGQE